MFVLLGLPGSGKSVQANLFKERKGIDHIAPGILLRKKAKSTEDEKLRNILKTGQLINDKIVADIIDEEIKKINNSIFIIEGYPRTLEQITNFKDILKDKNKNYLIKKVIVLECEPDTIINRLIQRKVCQQCHKSFQNHHDNCDVCHINLTSREDDYLEAIKNRITSQNYYLNQILDYLSEEGIEVIKISGENSIEEVYNSLHNIIYS